MTSSRGYSGDRAELTGRMRAVLSLAALGRTVPETAVELGVSVGTVNAVRAAALARLGVPNVVAAVAAALRKGELL